MSTPTVIKVIAENLAEEARGLAPGEGRRRPVEVDVAGVRTWLENFSALPALEVEDAEARLHLAVPARRLVVRRAGGRLGAEEGETFVAATVEEIVAQLLAAAPVVAAAVEEIAPEEARAVRARVRAQAWLLAGLVAIFAVVCWWTLRPETPDGVEWISNAAERQAILARAAGSYTNDDERLTFDAATARLTATDLEGEETLRTTVRVGRRAGATVLVTEAGVLLELTANGQLRLESSDYRRVP